MGTNPTYENRSWIRINANLLIELLDLPVDTITLDARMSHTTGEIELLIDSAYFKHIGSSSYEEETIHKFYRPSTVGHRKGQLLVSWEKQSKKD